MSSTLRGYERHKSDYYITPVDKITDFLTEFKKHEPSAFEGKILDPCAGGDENHHMSYPVALENMGWSASTIDIREDSLAGIKGDYLEFELLGGYPKVIITNPPFDIAESIIRKSLDDVQGGGFVIMLLRLNFFGSIQRQKLWEDIGLPKYTFVHHRRMSFTDNGKTDSIEYAHFVWQKGINPKFSQIKVI